LAGSNRAPDPTEHPVWLTDEALAFLTERSGLRRALPGFVTENHGELFPRWRSAIAEQLLVPPFHVTHVDAHADLGLGDAGYRYLLTDPRGNSKSETSRYYGECSVEGGFALCLRQVP
jgi:hypothetical protein